MNIELEQSRQLNKLYVDMYEGVDKDNPSVISRLLLVEDQLGKLKDNQEKYNTDIRWVVKLVFATLIAALLNLIIHFPK